MTEYWKSYEKKYCDVCKCWIADNKISVSIHEGGKKHQENVKMKIKDLVKKTTKDLKNQKKLDSEMQKMEDEAMKAYMKDIEANPDLSSTAVKEKITPSDSDNVQEEPVKKKLESSTHKPAELKPSDWYESKSDDGHTYYWNTTTNETCWEPPSEGYISLKQQKEIENQQKLVVNDTQKEMNAAIERSKMEVKYKEKIEQNLREKREAEESAAAYREEVKAGTASIGPTKKVHGPYGAWTTVTATKQAPLVLDLPVPPPVVVPSVPLPKRERIKEKTWDQVSLNTCKAEPVQFKKRKFGGNVRRRMDDDE